MPARHGDVTFDEAADRSLQHGAVVRLNPSAGFGYVSDAEGSHHYIFVYGTAIQPTLARQLRVGGDVLFRLSEDGLGRVEELVPA